VNVEPDTRLITGCALTQATEPDGVTALDGDPARWAPGTTVEPGTVSGLGVPSRGRCGF
jgi:hypothetical protein